MIKLYVIWFVGVSLFVAFCTANTIGYCMYGFTKYTHEDALVFALHDAASYSSWIIPEFRTLDDAREYLLQNPDCCGVSVGNKPVKTAFGLRKGGYSFKLPAVTNNGENFDYNFGYELTNCLKVGKVERGG